jgi:hypothetical protein
VRSSAPLLFDQSENTVSRLRHTVARGLMPHSAPTSLRAYSPRQAGERFEQVARMRIASAVFETGKHPASGGKVS